VPQSRQRKINKAKKRPRVHRVVTSEGAKATDGWNLKFIAIVAVAAIALASVVYVLSHRSSTQAGTEVTTPSGLKYSDLVVGNGESPKVGQTVTVNYIGSLEDGTKFDSSADQGRPLSFRIGTGGVIKGWDEGLMTMKVGGKRRLTVPAKLGYGAVPRPKIPANSTLIFEVEMLGIK
jgi:peptidylprolyl isomerase